MKTMNFSGKGLTFLIRMEGKINTVYKDSAGLDTIGVGHLITKPEKATGKILIGDSLIDFIHGLTDNEVETLLKQDLARFERTINTLVRTSLTQNQYDALVSFCFNVGQTAFTNSSLLKELNKSNYSGIANELRKWKNSGGKPDPILIKRRESEIELFNFAKY